MLSLFCNFCLIVTTCPMYCKCNSGATSNPKTDVATGGKYLDSHGYCNHWCSKGGYCCTNNNCKDGNAKDCTKCRNGKWREHGKNQQATIVL